MGFDATPNSVLTTSQLVRRQNAATPLFVVSNTPPKEATHLKLTQIHPLACALNPQEFEAVVFTSKHAAISLAKSLDAAALKALCLDSQTASVAASCGFDAVDFKAAEAREFASKIAQFYAQNGVPKKPLLWARGAVFSKDLTQLLADFGLNASSVSVYENRILKVKASLQPPQNSAILFTSGINAKAFLQNFEWQKNYLAFASGKSAKKELLKAGVEGVCVCKSTKIDDCVRQIKLFLAKN